MSLTAARPLALGVALIAGSAGVARAQPMDGDDSQPVTSGALRVGAYEDSDQTSVLRTLAEVAANWEHWVLTGSAAVDVVTSASIDVRTSPELSAVDVVTSASGRSSTSGGQMTDRRIQATGGAQWSDGTGHTLSLTNAGAVEADYASISTGVTGSVDVYDRAITLLGGINATKNWIFSVLDRDLQETMFNFGWSVGAAYVMTRNDAVRLRYDGSLADGYQASPYRAVRFGDWTTSTGTNQQITFSNTIGPAEGLPEQLPEDRLRHALVFEWVHALGDGVGLHPSIRAGRDSWGVQSLTGALDLRVARPTWRMQLGYRAYLQYGADFFQGKYTMDPAMYTYYTADKELGDEVGHSVSLDISRVLREPADIGGTRLLIDGRVSLMYYSYPGFELLDSRTGAFAELGLTWEL